MFLEITVKVKDTGFPVFLIGIGLAACLRFHYSLFSWQSSFARGYPVITAAFVEETIFPIELHGDPGCRQASALGLVSEGENSRVTGSSQRGRAGLELAGCGPRTTGCSQRGSYVRCPPGCRLPPAPSQLHPKVEAPHHSISITRPGRLYGLHAISSSVIVTHRCLSSLRLGGGPVLRLLKGHLCPTLKAGGSVGPR